MYPTAARPSGLRFVCLFTKKNPELEYFSSIGYTIKFVGVLTGVCIETKSDRKYDDSCNNIREKGIHNIVFIIHIAKSI